MSHPRIILPLFIAVILLGAAWVVTTPDMQTFQDADVVLFALTSTQAWTPFYWDQDRLGMLLPLLAMPIANPFLNLLFQEWLSLSATFLCAWAVALCFTNARLSMMIGIASTFILTALLPAETLFDFIAHPEYSVALALGLTGVHCLLRSRQSRGILRFTRTIASLAGFTLSLWVNITMPLVILPLLLATGIWRIFSRPSVELQDQGMHRACARMRETVLPVTALLAVACLINYMLVRTLDLPSTPTDILPPSMWLTAWRSAAALLWQKQAFVHVALLLTALCIASTCYGFHNQCFSVKAALPTVMILLAACAYFLVVGISEHVFYSAHYRYFIPVVILFVAGGLTLSFLALQRTLLMKHPAPISLVLAVAVLFACAFRYGKPSIRESENALDKRWGDPARAIISHECTHIMGDYWQVWPAVFWTNHLFGKASASNRIYGITYRCGPSAEEWKDMQPAHFRIAGFKPIAKAYAFGPLPFLPELEHTRIILDPDLYLYEATPPHQTMNFW